MSGVPAHGAPGPPGVLPASRWRAMRGFALVGVVAIVAGGLVAALTGPTGFAEGAWVAAYLVLVAGVAQVGLGAGQGLLAAVVPSTRRRGWQLILYNAANIAVLGGTLTASVAVVVAGSAMLMAALMLFLTTVRGTRTHRWYLAIYRALLAVLAVSIPLGVVVSVLRHG